MPRHSRSCGLQRESDLSEQASLGTGGCEGHADSRDGFDDACAELEEPEPQRGPRTASYGIRHSSGCVMTGRPMKFCELRLLCLAAWIATSGVYI